MMGIVELLFILFSSVAALLNGFVLLTVIMFPDMRKRLFMPTIICISLCDFLASIASAWGFPNQDSPLCPIQSFFIQVFYKGSWLWTTVLSLNNYMIAYFGRTELPFLLTNVICWSIALGTSLLPLISNKYGRDDDAQLAWCSYTGNEFTAGIWILVTFDIVLLCTFLLNVYFLARIYFDKNLNRKENAPVFAVLDAIIWYPPGFLFTWGPNLIFSIILNFNIHATTTEVVDIFDAVSILATQSGTVFAIIFICKCREARIRWARLLGPWCSYLLSLNRKGNEVVQSTGSDKRLYLSEDAGASEIASKFTESMTLQPTISENIDFDAEDIQNRFTVSKGGIPRMSSLSRTSAVSRNSNTSSLHRGSALQQAGRPSATLGSIVESSSTMYLNDKDDFGRLSRLSERNDDVGNGETHNVLIEAEGRSSVLSRSSLVGIPSDMTTQGTSMKSEVAESEETSSDVGWSQFDETL